MSDLRELYQQTILDHNKHPRNCGCVAGANRGAAGYNPLCGDEITLQLKVNDQGVIEDVAFEGAGCAISTAAASMMTEAIRGQPEEVARQLLSRYHAVLTADAAGEVDADDLDRLGKLVVFAGVREFPARVKCATLAWHTLEAALSGTAEPASTE